jgi:hypothetical protein
MHFQYGYVRATEGTDGDHVDVYLGNNKFSDKVFIIHQQVPETGAYDEDKVLLGFNSAVEAKTAYINQYDNPKFYQDMTIVDMATFKIMLKEKRGMKLKKALSHKYISKKIVNGKPVYTYTDFKHSLKGHSINEEAKAYTSASDFMNNRKPMRLLISEIQPTKGHTKETTIGKHKPRNPNEPIRVSVDYKGNINIEDGNHRYFNLKQKGAKYISVLFGTQLDFTDRKYITELWDKANMQKAKRMPIGTVSRGRRKVSEGKWVDIRDPKQIKKKPIAEFTAKKAAPPVVDYSSVPLAEFIPIRNAKTPKEFEAFVTAYSAEDYEKKGAKTFVSATGKSGFVITGDGDLISVFSEPGAREGSLIMKTSIKNGAKKLDCFGDVLPKIYSKYGFEITESIKWDDQYAPDNWDYETHGRPNINFMKLNVSLIQKSKSSNNTNEAFTKLSLKYAMYLFGSDEVKESMSSNLQKAVGKKYVKKYFKNGRWNYIYPQNGSKRPKSMGSYASLKNLGGTTGGAIKVRFVNGEEKVLKRSTSEGHLKDEYTANRIYKILGINVPDVQLSHDKEGKLVQVADFIEGVPLSELHGDEQAEARDQIRDGFVADALVSNWDVLGMDNDNVIWDGSKIWRIDNGGSLRYRAQGKPKGAAFNSDVTEVESLRDPSRSASSVFGLVTDVDIQDQLTNVLAKKGVILAGIEDPKLRRIMEQRITNLVDRFGVRKSIPDGSMVKSKTTGQWYLLEKGKPIKFYWLGELRKSNGNGKKYYSADEVKARGMRWVTIRGARVLLQGLAGGGYVVVGGAGGKLSHLKIDNILSREDYVAKRKRIESKQKEETQKLTKEEIAEAAQKRKVQYAARKTARVMYTESVTTILGVTPDEIRDNITAAQMKELEDKARSMVEARKATKTMDKKTVEQEVEKQSEKELAKAVIKQIKNVEREALNTLMKDYMPEDPNAAPELKSLLDKDKALEILSARKQFRKAIKAIGAESADTPTDLKVGAVFASVTTSEMDEIQKQVKDQVETAKNIQLYDMLNAQSQAINTHIDQGAISALNGLIGDVYGAGATFTTDTVKELGIEAVARAVTAKIQQDGKGEVVRKALEEYVASERGKVVDRALKETKHRLSNADNLRELARDKDDAEAILSMASANGHALKQITAAQRALGTAVGSLRAAAHMINALEDPIADVVQVDMGKDLARARERAKSAGLAKGTYSIRTVKRGRGKRLVMEIPKESLNSFFQGAAEYSATRDKLTDIKAHKANTGYKPPGIKANIKFDAAQEAGLRFFNEKGRVLLDFEAGIGKTGIAYAGIMDAMANKGAKKILVVTPSATRGDFHKQREVFLEPEMQKLVRQSTANTSKTERHRRHLEQDGIHIISQDALRQDASILKEAGYDMVVVDEIHEMTAGSGAAGRYKAMDQLADVPLKMAMSGTNIKTAKKELYRKINFIDPEHGLGSMADFEKRYKGLNQGTGIFQDAANDAFRKELGDWVYTQKNQLPVENKINTLRVPMSTEQRSAYAASERQYREERDNKLPGASARRDSRNYSILSNGFTSENKKVDTIIDTMKKSHPGEKAVIHVSQPGKPVLKAMKTTHERLVKEFGKGSVGTIHGGTSPGELTKIKAAFNDPGNPLRFIIGTKSLESGHNLQAGGSVTFHLDIPESAAAFDQRNARVFRKGQDKDTSTYVLSGVNPMDMRSEDLMATKRKEMNIIGNPRSVTALDDEGFLGMLNKYEEEARSA